MAGRISARLSTGTDLKLAGFVCPFYEIDETKLGKGFGAAISGIGVGSLENFPRYRKKFDKLLRLVSVLNELFEKRMGLSLTVLIGDTGVIQPQPINISRARSVIGKNIDAYKKYMINNCLGIKGTKVNFCRFSDLTGSYLSLGEPLSDLYEDGERLHNQFVSFPVNENILQKVKNEQLESSRKGISIYEPAGFMLNYGLAGMALKNSGTDILIGTDTSGSYMNYLYHSFIGSEELLVVVPK